jgi:hypothetical protein
MNSSKEDQQGGPRRHAAGGLLSFSKSGWL